MPMFTRCLSPLGRCLEAVSQSPKLLRDFSPSADRATAYMPSKAFQEGKLAPDDGRGSASPSPILSFYPVFMKLPANQRDFVGGRQG